MCFDAFSKANLERKKNQKKCLKANKKQILTKI
jgi:hypothetical protein